VPLPDSLQSNHTLQSGDNENIKRLQLCQVPNLKNKAPPSSVKDLLVEKSSTKRYRHKAQDCLSLRHSTTIKHFPNSNGFTRAERSDCSFQPTISTPTRQKPRSHRTRDFVFPILREANGFLFSYTSSSAKRRPSDASGHIRNCCTTTACV
jgi:hypothetical protein